MGEIEFDADQLSAVQKAYDLMAEEYDIADLHVPFFLNGCRTCGYYVDTLATYWKNRVVLDVGCGTGHQSIRFASGAKKVIALDVSPAIIEKARTKARQRALTNIDFLLGSATNVPLDDQSVDYVSAYGDVIGHITQYESAFSEMARVCRSGGVVTLEYDNKWHIGLIYQWRDLIAGLGKPNTGEFRIWTYQYISNGFKVNFPIRNFTFEEISKLCATNRLVIHKVAGIHFLSLIIPPRFQNMYCDGSLFHRLIREAILRLGRIDFHLKETFPFNRFGYSSILVAQKL